MKQCPECKNFIGDYHEVCVCGHWFISPNQAMCRHCGKPVRIHGYCYKCWDELQIGKAIAYELQKVRELVNCEEDRYNKKERCV